MFAFEHGGINHGVPLARPVCFVSKPLEAPNGRKLTLLSNMRRFSAASFLSHAPLRLERIPRVPGTSWSSADKSKLPSTARRVKRAARAYYASAGSILTWACVLAIILVSVSVGVGRLVANRFFATSRGTNKQPSSDRWRLLSSPTITRKKQDATELYRPDDAMPGLGDLSQRYAQVRKDIDDRLPEDDHRTAARIKELSKYEFESFQMSDPGSDKEVYDIYNCPFQPPRGYPYQWNLLKLLENWNPDDTTPRSTIYNGLCVFDFEQDYEKALNYRSRDLPFVVINDPSVQKAAERWSHPGYMQSLLGDRKYGTTLTRNNHFMYGNPTRRRSVRNNKNAERLETWYGTTTQMEMTYDEWLRHATLPEEELAPEKPRWYFRLIGCGNFRGDVCRNGDYGSEYLLDELPFFQPKEGLYLVEPDKQAGIHCRFGMKGLIAENHWDAGRNAIALLGGVRRYILASLDMCDRLALYPKGHPSGRHSAVDWSNPDLEKYPEFAQARANEVVLQPGQLLYLPGKFAVTK
jgi:Cupin-like domain